jgi:hypothetical protein
MTTLGEPLTALLTVLLSTAANLPRIIPGELTVLPCDDFVVVCLELAAPAAGPAINAIGADWRSNTVSGFSRCECQRRGAWGRSTQREKEKRGELFGFPDGRKQIISADSLFRHLIWRIVLARPRDGPAKKAGVVSSTVFRSQEVTQDTAS